MTNRRSPLAFLAVLFLAGCANQLDIGGLGADDDVGVVDSGSFEDVAATDDATGDDARIDDAGIDAAPIDGAAIDDTAIDAAPSDAPPTDAAALDTAGDDTTADGTFVERPDTADAGVDVVVAPDCGPPVTCGVGVCARTGETCGSADCTPGTPSTTFHTVADSRTSSFDFDCNGKVEQQFDSASCTSGLLGCSLKQAGFVGAPPACGASGAYTDPGGSCARPSIGAACEPVPSRTVTQGCR